MADFHSFRHTFISNLARGGVHPKLAQALARHSTITLTMDRYSHTVLGEQSDALAALPDLTGPARQEQRATGTDGRNTVAAEQAEPPKSEPERLAFCLAQLDSKQSASVHHDSVSERSDASDKKRNNPRNVRTKRGILPAQKEVVRGGIEPPTHGFSVRCSTN